MCPMPYRLNTAGSSNLLRTVMVEKYGMAFQSSTQMTRSTVLHFPQLFLALQYHTGARFKDSPHYEFCDPFHPHPLTEDDLLNAHVPVVKLRMAIPGLVGMVEGKGEALLGAGLFIDAACVFRLRLSSLSLLRANDGEHRYVAQVAYNTYNLALALYLSCEYSEAVTVMRSHLCRPTTPKFNALSARMMTLLTAAHFQMHDMAAAMEVFDAGQQAICFSVGKYHPLHAIHMIVLVRHLAPHYFLWVCCDDDRCFMFPVPCLCPRTHGVRTTTDAGGPVPQPARRTTTQSHHGLPRMGDVQPLAWRPAPRVRRVLLQARHTNGGDGRLS